MGVFCRIEGNNFKRMYKEGRPHSSTTSSFLYDKVKSSKTNYLKVSMVLRELGRVVSNMRSAPLTPRT